MTSRSRTFLISVSIVVLMGIAAWYFLRTPVGIEPAEELESKAAATGVELQLPAIENKAFAVGEKLHYKIIYKGITVGHSTIEVTDGPLVNGRPTLKYVSKARSTPFFDAFFKVRDENVSTVDSASLFSVAFDQNLREGRSRAIRHYDFDYKQGRFTSSEEKKGTTKQKDGLLQTPFHDVLSALYAVRAHTLTPGRDLTLAIFRAGAGQQRLLKIDGTTKELKTKLGKVSCLRIEPVVQGDPLFKSKDTRLVVWMTNDARKIPVLIEATISVGLIRVKLDKWEK